MAIQRIRILGVPVDICRPEQLEGEIMELMAKQGTKQIVFLTVWKLLKARNKKSVFSKCLEDADLILPVSKSIIMAARFLKCPTVHRYNPFNAMIQILTVLERHVRSIYLLGGRKRTLMQTERNILATFRALQIVGRYVGYYPKSVEENIVKAIFKASPNLVIVSEGVRGKDTWAYTRKDKFSSSIFLYYREIFGIFSARRRRVSEEAFDKGLEVWDEIFHNPFKIFLILPYFKFMVILLFHKLFRKNEYINF